MAASKTIRFLSPGSSKGPSTTHSGKAPSAAAGGVTDLPDNSADIQILEANGWTRVGYVGTTAQRPELSVPAGFKYLDTTLSKLVQYDGVGWRDPLNGASV